MSFGTAKYVICRNGEMGMEYPVIFPYYVYHSTFAKMRPVSAGFVTFDPDNGWRTFGESVSLGISSNESDAKIIEKTIGEGLLQS